MEIDFYGFFCYREHRETKTVQTTRIKKILGKSFMLLRDMVYFSKRLLKLKKFLIRDRTEKIERAKIKRFGHGCKKYRKTFLYNNAA